MISILSDLRINDSPLKSSDLSLCNRKYTKTLKVMGESSHILFFVNLVSVIFTVLSTLRLCLMSNPPYVVRYHMFCTSPATCCLIA